MSTQTPGFIDVQLTEASKVEHMKAYDITEADRARLVTGEIIQVYTDPRAASSDVVAVATRAAAYEPEIVAMPGGIGVGLLANVKTCALAAAQAHQNYLGAEIPGDDIGPVIEALKAKRETLLADARALVQRKLLKAEQIAEVSGSLGYRAVTYDVGLLCTVLRAAWPKIASRTGVTMAEIEEAHVLAEQAEAAVMLRENNEQRRAAANDQRQRAFTLMVLSYNQLRRCLGFILWDANTLADFAPPLGAFSGRRAGSKRDADEEEPAAAPAAGAPVPANGTTTPVNGGAATAAPPKPGMPGSSPFIT